MKVLMINGSPRNGGTCNILKELNEKLISKGVESTIVNINDYYIRTCRGCYNCIMKGVEHCPLKEDDAKELWNMMTQSKVVVAGIPVYSLGVPGIFKNFMDRIAYNCHRPLFQGKTMITVVTTAGMGIRDVIKQMNWFNIMGFNVTGSEGFLIYPNKKDTPAKKTKDSKRKDKLVKLIEDGLKSKPEEKVQLIKYLQFQALKLNSVFGEDVYEADREFFREKEYYFPVKLNWFYRWYGKLFFKIGYKSMMSQYIR